jgi:hypothetical protein
MLDEAYSGWMLEQKMGRFFHGVKVDAGVR